MPSGTTKLLLSFRFFSDRLNAEIVLAFWSFSSWHGARSGLLLDVVLGEFPRREPAQEHDVHFWWSQIGVLFGDGALKTHLRMCDLWSRAV